MKFKAKRAKKQASPTMSPDRCAGCYRWPKRIAAMSVYVPKDGGAPVPYSLCAKCVARLRKGDQTLVHQIETYISNQPVTDQPAN